MIIPWQDLAEDTLRNLLEEYVSRDGTDYGEQEVSLARKVLQVQRQLQDKILVIWFDQATASTTLLPAAQVAPAKTDSEQADAVERLSAQDGVL
jgi:uncharacterized protein YheU (UPF0270 family)